MTPSKVSSGALTVFKDADQLAEEVATWLLARASAAEHFSVCLSGGSTPKRLYEKLASPAFVNRFPLGQDALVLGRRKVRSSRSPGE